MEKINYLLFGAAISLQVLCLYALLAKRSWAITPVGFMIVWHVLGDSLGDPITRLITRSDGPVKIDEAVGLLMVIIYVLLAVKFWIRLRQTDRGISSGYSEPVVTQYVEPGQYNNQPMQPTAQPAATESADTPPEFDVTVPSINFSHIFGQKELKDSIMESMKEVTDNGKNGVLLYGTPGNGKTYFVEALTGELSKNLSEKTKGRRKVVLMSLSIADLASKWLNQTTEHVAKAFADAKSAAEKHGACVLFFDEVDSLMTSRDSTLNRSSDELKTVNAFLPLMVRYRSFADNGIIIVTATNFRDRLDAAAFREGRVDFKQEIKSPDYEGIVGLLTHTVKKAGAVLPRVEAERVAARWEGFSVSRVMRVGEIAARETLKTGKKDVSFDTLMSALREAQGCKGLNLKANTPSLTGLMFKEELKSRLELLARRMTQIAQIEEQGGSVPKGVLFYGPPGTGKTAVAQALAVSSGWAFLSTSGQKLMGDKGAFDDMVTKASDLRPCIVFIDEADDILGDRNDNPQTKSDTNNLLALMDGDRALKDVMFVAATNNPHQLDAAAIRGGRFSEHFEFEIPKDDTLTVIIRQFIESKTKTPWHPEFTPAAATIILSGMAPADAKDCLQQAINIVVSRFDGSQVTLADLEAVVQKTKDFE